MVNPSVSKQGTTWEFKNRVGLAVDTTLRRYALTRPSRPIHR